MNGDGEELGGGEGMLQETQRLVHIEFWASQCMIIETAIEDEFL
jgi:hypothetical protein